MKTFTIGQLEIDILRHVRVDGSRFPTPDPDAIADYFIIAARWQGQAIDFYPNQGRKADPLSFGFVGRKVVPVYELASGSEETGDAVYKQVGTKRGADFRSRFFPLLARRLGKAILARQAGKTVAALTAEDEAKAGAVVRRLLTADFQPPSDMRLMTIDGAARFLRDADGDLEAGEKPPGTVVNIDTDFDSNADSDGAQNETAITVAVGILSDGDTRRAQFRFPLGSIASGATINSSEWQANLIFLGNVDSGDVLTFRQYGTSDPDTDSAATKYANSGGTQYASQTGFDSFGSKSVALGMTANADIASQISSPGFFTVALSPGSGYTTSELSSFESIENTGSDPATLTVDYTESTGPEEVPLAGNLPAMSGVVAVQYEIAAAGDMPAPTGTIEAAALYTDSVAGNMPAPSGVVEALYNIAVAGNMPSPSGVLALAAQIALAGNLPAPSGVAAVLTRIALAGAMPAPSGAVLDELLASKGVSGILPAPSGAIEALYNIALAGNMPAPTGALSLAAMIALAGAMPSPSGAVNSSRTAAVSGILPAMSGVLALAAEIALAGNLPAMSGVIEEFYEIALAGSMPAPSGTAAALALVLLFGDLPAPSGALSLDASIALAGEMPAPSGLLRTGADVALAGELPAMSGLLEAVLRGHFPQSSIGGRVPRLHDAVGRIGGPPGAARGRRNSP